MSERTRPNLLIIGGIATLCIAGVAFTFARMPAVIEKPIDRPVPTPSRPSSSASSPPVSRAPAPAAPSLSPEAESRAFFQRRCREESIKMLKEEKESYETIKEYPNNKLVHCQLLERSLTRSKSMNELYLFCRTHDITVGISNATYDEVSGRLKDGIRQLKC